VSVAPIKHHVCEMKLLKDQLEKVRSQKAENQNRQIIKGNMERIEEPHVLTRKERKERKELCENSLWIGNRLHDDDWRGSFHLGQASLATEINVLLMALRSVITDSKDDSANRWVIMNMMSDLCASHSFEPEQRQIDRLSRTKLPDELDKEPTKDQALTGNQQKAKEIFFELGKQSETGIVTRSAWYKGLEVAGVTKHDKIKKELKDKMVSAGVFLIREGGSREEYFLPKKK